MSALLNFSIVFLLTSVILAMLCVGFRLLMGPTAQDRILALDTLWMCGMIFVLGLGIRYSSQVYFEVAMLIALTGFVSTVALTKFLMRGEIIE